MYTHKTIGTKYTVTYKMYIQDNEKIISPFHDIPYMKNGNIQCINEISRFENAKFEINKKEAMNPIMQDVKNEICRFVHNIFPFKGYPWNYGAIPQTWEDPRVKDEFVNELGDNDPIDVIEIGTKIKKMGDVYEAKVLGCLGLIDDGECDWKILVIDINDEKANSINDIEDVDEAFPGLLEATLVWFKNYKVPAGKGYNKFAFDGKYQNKEFAMKVIEKAHESWVELINDIKGIEKICTKNSTNPKSENYTEEEFIVEGGEEIPHPIPSETFEYSFVKKE